MTTFPVTPLRRLAQGGGLFTDGDWVETPFITDGGIRLVQTGNVGVGVFRDQGFRYISNDSFSTLNCTEVIPGDLLISRLADPVGRSCIAPDLGVRMITSVDVAILRPRPGVADTRYLNYYLSSRQHLDAVAAIARGGTRERISRDQLGYVPVPIPAMSTQRTIADYLDCETARIDALIEKKRRMVELLEERRGSARETLVAEGWRAGEVLRLGYLLSEIDDRLGPAPPPPLLSVSIHHGVIPFAQANPEREPRADDLEHYKRCRRGDIVLNRMRAFQGGIGRAMEDGIVSPDYAVLRPTVRGFAGYLNHLLRSPWFVGEMEALLRGIGGVDQGNVRTPRVNWDDLRTVVVPSPPPDTQVALAERLDLELTKTSKTQQVVERQVALLQERRQALISAAVTGEFDITAAAT